MVTNLQITRFLNKLLDIKNIPDYSKNGMQFRGAKEIKKIGFAVDASIETYEKAKKQNCDLVIVHHGLFWKKSSIPKERIEKHLKFLKKNKLSLYASHLPLDLHNEYGNNILLAKLLGLKKIKGFGDYNGITIGFGGELKSKTFDELMLSIEEKIGTLRGLNFGKNKIKKISVITGRASKLIIDSANEGYDCLITGEILHETYHDAKEYKTNVISCGHYATEVFGVKALMPVLEEKFGVKTTFIDIPTGL